MWATNSKAKQKMIEGLKKSGIKKGYMRIPREIRTCEECMEAFEVIVTSSQKYCSRRCSGKVAMKNTAIQYMEKRRVLHQSIRDYIIQWSVDNKEIVLRTPLNKIKTTIAPLIHDIKEQFGVKDFRVISKAVFGKDRGRKELIMFMKNVCNENIC